MQMQKRKMKVIFNKAGGNASKKSYGAKISLPKVWIDEMGVTPEDREVLLGFSDAKIIIEKIDIERS